MQQKIKPILIFLKVNCLYAKKILHCLNKTNLKAQFFFIFSIFKSQIKINKINNFIEIQEKYIRGNPKTQTNLSSFFKE